jgi:hypothetical protein
MASLPVQIYLAALAIQVLQLEKLSKHFRAEQLWMRDLRHCNKGPMQDRHRISRPVEVRRSHRMAWREKVLIHVARVCRASGRLLPTEIEVRVRRGSSFASRVGLPRSLGVKEELQLRRHDDKVGHVSRPVKRNVALCTKRDAVVWRF